MKRLLIIGVLASLVSSPLLANGHLQNSNEDFSISEPLKTSIEQLKVQFRSLKETIKLQGEDLSRDERKVLRDRFSNQFETLKAERTILREQVAAEYSVAGLEAPKKRDKSKYTTKDFSISGPLKASIEQLKTQFRSLKETIKLQGEDLSRDERKVLRESFFSQFEILKAERTVLREQVASEFEEAGLPAPSERTKPKNSKKGQSRRQ